MFVLYDQMYWQLTYGAIEHYNPVSLYPAMREYTIFVDAISKAFAATGNEKYRVLGRATGILDEQRSCLE